MKPKEVDIESLKSIDDLYLFMEVNAFEIENNRDLLNILIRFKELDVPANDKEMAHWEIMAFAFTWVANEVFAYSTTVHPESATVERFPSLIELDREGFAYLKQRAEVVQNPVLSARYNHLLWKAPNGVKNKRYGLKAIDGYISIIQLYILLYEQKKPIHRYKRVTEAIVNLCNLCAETKEKIIECKALIHRLLFETFGVQFDLKHQVIETMLSLKTLFKPSDFNDFLSIYESEWQQGILRKDTTFWTQYYLPTAISLARRLSGDINIWNERIGDSFMIFAEGETQEDRLWLKYNAYTNAIVAYRIAGNAEKRKEVEQLAFQLKSKVKLSHHRVLRSQEEVKNLNNMRDYIKKDCKKLLKESPEVIYVTLITGWFYPNKKLTANASKKLKFFSKKFFTTVDFDRNKNIKKRKNDNEDTEKFNKVYHYFIEFVTLQYLYYTFVPGIRSGQLTYDNFLAFLRDHTWLGKPYLKTDLGGNDININWLSLVGPAIIEYFVQVQCWTIDNNYIPNLVLCIDSLTLKIEGLIRCFSEYLGVSTIIGIRNGIQEAYIHNMLENEVLKEYFTPEDLQYFKYLFINEEGINLRNNVAHCYYNATDYTIDKCHLLLAAILKIGKYNLVDDET